ncbi:putative MFS-type transporter -like protein [Sarcoptes scabiei]|uniref:Putative MFS-type transporter -like protein n=1 Tax=Sarcoptes scabiei TaxID=52283 RepID=A0A834RCU3_SARSC|nr:putative MFS-type transporter -like protein [Sarcoptes scabiei]
MIASNENFDTVRQQHQRLPSDEEKSTNHPSHTSIRSHITTDISNNPNDLDSSKLMDNIEKEQFENFPNNQIEKSGSMKETEQSRHEEIKTYRIRNFLLTLFILLSMSNAFHWIEYAIIENIITKYFNISTFWVNCTSTIYMFSYIIGIIPPQRTRFWLVMIGQTSVAIAQLYILNIPPLLAATWFPSSEVTRATAYGVFGNQVGIAIGFVIPPLLMPNLDDNSKNSSTITVESLNSTVEAEKYRLN